MNQSPSGKPGAVHKAKDGAIGRSAPLEFLSPTERQAVLTDDRSGFRPSLYKAFLFLHVASAIKAGKLNMRHSYKYRPLDDYLIDRKRWDWEEVGRNDFF
ncbi:MAG TPA: hypothetical protein PLI17_10115, partial [Denitromonas sp.]|nr:hypothetical protein [Denitromonas sp.]